MTDRNLKGKTAVVTGAARGIGAAIAVELATHGADLVMCDVASREAAARTIETIANLGRPPIYFQGDVGNRAQMEALFENGRVDILVNNAARSIRKPLLELEVADVERVWAVALWGVFHCSQLAARRMVAQGTGGSIVVISSVHAVRAFPLSTAYNGAKAAVNHMACKWAAELASARIRVNIEEPGWIDTPGERTFHSEDQIREEGRKLPVNAANSIRMFGGWILQIQTWPISAMRRSKLESTPR